MTNKDYQTVLQGMLRCIYYYKRRSDLSEYAYLQLLESVYDQNKLDSQPSIEQLREEAEKEDGQSGNLSFKILSN